MCGKRLIIRQERNAVANSAVTNEQKNNNSLLNLTLPTTTTKDNSNPRALKIKSIIITNSS